MTTPRVIAYLTAACVSLPSQATAQGGDRHRQVDTVFAPWAGRATPGCAVGISRDGVLDYGRGYGMSNLEHDLPITPQSVFQAASIAKQFTAFAIGLLAQERRLSLGDDIRKYLPEMPDYRRTITIAHLVHHTSGLREQGQLLNLAGWRNDDQYTEADILWALTKQRSLNFEPGAEIVYGNAAYTLLGVIVRRVSGKSLQEFAEERIFRPLGMAETRYVADHTEILPRRASAYAPRAGGGWQISVPGSASLNTTVGDLLKWEQNLLDGRVGGRALMEWMRTSGKLNDGTATYYGGGLFLNDYRGLRMVSHDGADGGYRADALLFPDHRLAVVALCNGATIVPPDLTRKVAEVYLGDRMKDETPPAVTLPVSELSELAGNYWSQLTDEVVRLEVKDGALRQVGLPSALVPVGQGVFRPAESMHVWRFSRPDAGAPHRLSIKDFWPTTRDFTRVTAPVPTAAAVSSFAGQYRSEEVDMTYTVRVANGKLAIRWPRRDEVVLDAVGGDRFVGSLGTVSFTRGASREVDGLTISNRRLRRLRADRLVVEQGSRAEVSCLELKRRHALFTTETRKTRKHHGWMSR
jgi:CubicO group peptidase (beta-lactamase class C family)